MTDELQRLRDALWRIKVDPHGHPGEPGRPVPDDDCPVCRVVNEALGRRMIPAESWERATDPALSPGVIKIDGQPMPLVEFMDDPELNDGLDGG
jgi:hypothetical protein